MNCAKLLSVELKIFYNTGRYGEELKAESTTVATGFESMFRM